MPDNKSNKKSNKNIKRVKRVERSGWYGGDYSHKKHNNCTHFEYRSYYYPYYYSPYYESVYSGLKQSIYSPDKYYTK